MADLQGTISMSSAPSAVFADLSRKRQSEVFFVLPETVRESLVADMSRKKRRGFV